MPARKSRSFQNPVERHYYFFYVGCGRRSIFAFARAREERAAGAVNNLAKHAVHQVGISLFVCSASSTAVPADINC